MGRVSEAILFVDGCRGIFSIIYRPEGTHHQLLAEDSWTPITDSYLLIKGTHHQGYLQIRDPPPITDSYLEGTIYGMTSHQLPADS